MQWNHINTAVSRSYVCGYCSEKISSDKAYTLTNSSPRIYICHFCKKPTFFEGDGTQTPGAKYGGNVENLPNDIEELYTEARDAYGVNAFTCTVMCCRKILMHVAVSKEAEEGKRFAFYVSYLADNNIIPVGSKDWVDEIRNMANGANHEIIINTEENAKEIISFVEMLLKLVFEYPARIKPKEEK